MTRAARRRTRGAVDLLPSGTYRVRVYAGLDPLTCKRHYLIETADTAKEAERVRTRLLGQVDEKRSPRSKATVSQLLDRYLEVVELERTTRQGYIGKIEKHIRPEIGKIQTGRVDAELLGRCTRCSASAATTAAAGSSPSTGPASHASATGVASRTSASRSHRRASWSCTPSSAAPTSWRCVGAG